MRKRRFLSAIALLLSLVMLCPGSLVRVMATEEEAEQNVLEASGDPEGTAQAAENSSGSVLDSFPKYVVFVDDPVVLYTSVGSETNYPYSVQMGGGMPDYQTVLTAIMDEEGCIWYELDTTEWWETNAFFPFVKAEQTAPYSLEERTVAATFTCPDGTEVSCSVSGNIPEDVTLSVEPETLEESGLDTDTYSICDKTLVLDITPLLPDGTEWQPAEGENVTITIPSSAIGLSDGEYYYYYHIHDDGTFDSSDVLEISNDLLILEANSFSSFVVTGDTAEIDVTAYYALSAPSSNGNAEIPCAFFDAEGNMHILVKCISKSAINKLAAVKASYSIDGKTIESAQGEVVGPTSGNTTVTSVDINIVEDGQTIDTKSIVKAAGFVDYVFSKDSISTFDAKNGTIQINTKQGGFVIGGKITFLVDYSINKTLVTAGDAAGEEVVYSISVSNTGTAITGVSILDAFDDAVFDLSSAAVSSDGTSWTPLTVSSAGVATLGSGLNFATDQSTTYYVKASLKSNFTAGKVSNTATISGSSIIDKSSTAEYTVDPSAKSVSYKVDGEMVSSSTYLPRSTVTVIDDPVKIGYTFSGWTSTDVTISEGKFSMPDKDVVINGSMTPHTYKVEYSSNGGSGSMDDQEFTYDVSQSLTTNSFTNGTKIFAGWNTKADGTGTSYANGQTVSNLSSKDEDVITLYAIWTDEPLTYTVQWVNYDATVLETDTEVTANSTPTYDGATPQRAADVQYIYSFTGWSPTISPVTADITYTAQYEPTPVTYTAQFNANGGTSVDEIEYTFFDPFSFPEAPVRVGYHFKGWKVNADSGSWSTSHQPYSASENVDSGNFGDVTFDALWDTIRYQIIFDSNGGGESSKYQECVYNVATNLDKNTFSYSHHEFAGWNTAADGSGTAYTDKQEIKNLCATQGGQITLYAQWLENLTLEYDWGTVAPSGCTIPTDSNVYYTKDDARSNIDATYYAGYVKESDGVRYVFSGWTADTDPDENYVIHVRGTWKPTYYVTIYKRPGVASATGGGYHAVGEEVRVTPTYHTGYRYDPSAYIGFSPADVAGYRVEEDGTVIFTMPERNAVVNLEACTTLYYHADEGGSVSSSKDERVPSPTYSQAYAGSTATPDEGYEFDGWYTEAGGKGTKCSSNPFFKPDTNTYFTQFHYYAHFIPKKYELGSLKITKSGAADAGESFIFHVSSKVLEDTAHEAVNLTVCVQGNGSVTIVDLPVGTYEITEESSWSWRYTASQSVTTAVVTGGQQASATVANTQTKFKWLTGNDYVVNK